MGSGICRGLSESSGNPSSITKCKAAVCQSDGCNDHKIYTAGDIKVSYKDLNSTAIYHRWRVRILRTLQLQEKLRTVYPFVLLYTKSVNRIFACKMYSK